LFRDVSLFREKNVMLLVLLHVSLGHPGRPPLSQLTFRCFKPEEYQPIIFC